jgi:hypothetical protein
MKKSDYFNKVTSERTGVELATVKAVTRFFWREVRREISGLKHSSIFVKNLGTFVISPAKLRKVIGEVIEKIKNVRANPNMTEEKKLKVVGYEYQLLQRLLEKRNEMALVFYKPSNVKTNGTTETDTDSSPEPGESAGGMDQ